ncbi:hypothetical protein BGX26_000252 [Mortierella sp. AD094]|nr:hypothetical protein BGX26_000252 [Mortierella sp. AD094]
MTLITSPTPLTPLYSYPCINTHTSADTYSIANASGLSWLQPATAPASTPSSQKYRTLASIQSQTLQQSLYNIDAPPTSPLSPSVKPTPFDSLAGDHHHHHHHPQSQPLPLSTSRDEQPLACIAKSASSITSAIQDMDNSHGTCFLTWIHNPSNLDYISLRLRPLCLEYPLVDVANVLRWIGADWSSADCKALFRAVTQSWDQGKRRMLAFLLIRDEEMRQKAKSKLVEFAQKSRVKNQFRRPQQNQPQQQQQQHMHPRQLHPIQSSVATTRYMSVAENLSEHSVQRAVKSVGSVEVPTTTSSVESRTLADLAAASIITGLDIFEPSFPLQDSVACAPKVATTATIRQHRFSPY